jgi:predicted ThiF/HesA family dinucleotide-utilizing enzyme
VLHAFVYNEIAILVRHWFEVSLKDSHLEHGVRLELRLREPQPHRGSESAAQRIVADQPVWRADLFDRIDGTPGAFEAAHFHPRFTGVEPCERNWADVIKAAPWDWLDEQLQDIAAVAAAGGVTLPHPEADTEQVRADRAAIVATAQSRAATQCGSKEQCYAWTQDAAPTVHLMLGSLARPDLLDGDRVSPWRETQPVT